MLSFEFNSEGRNQTAADCALIPLDANEGRVRDLVVAASRQAHEHILNSFGVRMA